MATRPAARIERPAARVDGGHGTGSYFIGLTAISTAIKDSPPYLHDGRLLTLENTVEFFNLVLRTRLTDEEKQALVTFLRVL